jgi:predicted kinase
MIVDMKPALTVMVGISGSGKSFHANKLQTSLNAKLIETDALRQELLGSAQDQTQNGRIFAVARDRVNKFLAEGHNVIIDATSLNPKERKDWVEIGRANGAEVRAHFVEVSVDVAKQRNAQRLRQVPEWVIDRQISKLQPPTRTEGFDSVTKV